MVFRYPSDTSIDYITLTVTFCVCQPTTLPGDVTPAAIQPLASAAASTATVCDCLPASPRP